MVTPTELQPRNQALSPRQGVRHEREVDKYIATEKARSLDQPRESTKNENERRKERKWVRQGKENEWHQEKKRAAQGENRGQKAKGAQGANTQQKANWGEGKKRRDRLGVVFLGNAAAHEDKDARKVGQCTRRRRKEISQTQQKDARK